MPEYNLKEGDLGWLIDYLPVVDGEEGCILEIFNAVGESIDVATVPVSAIEELRDEAIDPLLTGELTISAAPDFAEQSENILEKELGIQTDVNSDTL